MLPAERSRIHSRESPTRRSGPEQLGDQLARSGRGQRRESDLLVARSIHPLGAEAGTKGDEHQQRPRLRRLDQTPEQLGARLVDPVQVVDRYDGRSRGARIVDQGLEQREEQPLPGRGVEPKDRLRGVEELEEVERDGKQIGQARVERGQPPPHLGSRALRRILFADPQGGAHQLDDREVRPAFPVSGAVGIVHRNVSIAAACQELAEQAALAEAGVADHAQRPAHSRAGALERVLESRELAAAADEARAAARQRGRPRPRASRAGETEDPHRCTRAGEVEGPLRLELEEVASQRGGRFGQVDLARRGERLQAGSDADGVPLGRVVAPQVATDAPDHDLAGVEAGPRHEVEATLAVELAAIRSEPVAERECREARAVGVVLVGGRRAEQRHDAVAGELVERAPEAVHGLAGDGEEALHDVVPVLGVHLRREADGALHVHEQHRDLLALAFARAARREHALAQMARCVVRAGGRALG